MKKIATSILLTSILTTNTLFAADGNSVKHFVFSGAFGYVAETILHNNVDLSNTEKVIYGTTLGVLPGLAKELSDTKFDNEDMAFNILGSFAGSYLSNYLNNNVFVSFEHNSKTKSDKVLVSYKF